MAHVKGKITSANEPINYMRHKKEKEQKASEPRLLTVFSRVMYVPPMTGSLTFAKNAIIGTYIQ